MAPPRKKKRMPGEGHPVALRLPSDVFERIEAEAKKSGRPMNRLIINDLAAIPQLTETAKLAERVHDLDVLCAKLAFRVTWQELSEQLVAAVDAVIATQGSAQQAAAIDRLRVFRAEMLKQEAKRK